jgi:hypothetical protein
MPIPPGLAEALADRYAIERELGSGGMALVFLARDLRHQRQVAIKVLRPELAASLGGDRFLREIQIVAQLQHPHILPLLDSGTADAPKESFLFYVMPFVEGPSLGQRLATSGELPVREAVKLLTEVTDALSYAHARGVVHRDIKPDNVMLSGRHALVTDFGVAKAVSAATGSITRTTAGVALGTPAYMAPEQAAADPMLDHRVDIYAVGALAYELLTGRPPFVAGSQHQVLAMHVSQDPDPLTRYRPGIAPELEAIVLRCLAKRPADRYQTADELLQALEPHAAPATGTTPVAVAPVSAAPRRLPWGLIGAAAVALTAVVWGLRERSRPFQAVQPDDAQLTFTGNATAPSLSASGDRMAYAARRCDRDGVCLYDVVVKDVGGTGAATVLGGLSNVWFTGWTRDGLNLLIGGSFNAVNWGVYSVSTLGGAPRYFGCCRGTLIGNGDTTLVSSYQRSDTIAWLRRVRTADGTTFDSIPVPKLTEHGVTGEVSGDGRWLLLLNGENREFVSAVVASREGVPRDTMLFPVEHLARGVVPVPGSSRIVVFARTGRGSDVVSAVEYTINDQGGVTAPGDTVLRSLLAGDAFYLGAANALAYASGTPTFGVWTFHRDRDRASTVRRLASSTSIGLTADASPDGRTLLLVRDVVTGGGTLKQLSLMSSDSGPERLLGHPADLVGWDITASTVVAAIRRGDSVVVESMDTATGRARLLASYARAEAGGLSALPGGGFAMLNAASDHILRHGGPGGADTAFDLGADAGSDAYIDASPDGRAVALVSWNPTLDSVVLRRVSLEDGSQARLAAIAAERPGAPRWLRDGHILVPVGETGLTVGLYEVPATGGAAVRLGALPLTEARYHFSSDGTAGVIRTADRNSDVHLIRNFGAMLR